MGAMNHQGTFASMVLPDDVNIAEDASLARFGNAESFFGANPVQTRSTIQNKRQAKKDAHDFKKLDSAIGSSQMQMNAQVLMKQLASSRRSSKDSAFSMNLQETLGRVLQNLENEQQQQQQNPLPDVRMDRIRNRSQMSNGTNNSGRPQPGATKPLGMKSMIMKPPGPPRRGNSIESSLQRLTPADEDILKTI